jgi:hypothetical protein
MTEATINFRARLFYWARLRFGDTTSRGRDRGVAAAVALLRRGW